MRDEKLLRELLEAEDETAVLKALTARGLLDSAKVGRNWRCLGGARNNHGLVLSQQSSATAAFVEKYTNGVDAILIRMAKSTGTHLRGERAPRTMADAIEAFFPDLNDENQSQDLIREFADERLVLYATGGKARPSLSLYDAGEGQLAKDFPSTFCSLLSAENRGSYKGAIPFVQGKFNMGGTGVLQFCSKERKLQLIVSRVPDELVDGGMKHHEWAFTIMCFFPAGEKNDPEWRYLVGDDGEILTAGNAPLGLVPKAGVPKGVPLPRERKVSCGTLIKMYDYDAPKSNICGELFKKIEEYLLRPPLPLRIVECRKEYTAKVMAVTVWDCMARWRRKKRLEPDFEDGASFELRLMTGETVPAEIRVFRDVKEKEEDPPHTGVRALVNGQSHGKRDSRFFRTKNVDKEHIAGSILVTLFCEGLSTATRNELFMSNREMLRDGSVLNDLLEKLQSELRSHEALVELNLRRYADKVKDAARDEDGIKALEDLLSTDPTLADLFGTLISGRVAANTSSNGTGTSLPGRPEPYVGHDFPTYFHRADKSTTVDLEISQNDVARVSFLTDVRNNYFTRRRPPRGIVVFSGSLPDPSYRLFNGRITFSCRLATKLPVGSELEKTITIDDRRGSGPFVLHINATVVPPRKQVEPGEGPRPKPPRVEPAPSQPSIAEMDLGPDAPPARIEKDPATSRLQITINRTCALLEAAKRQRDPEETPAVAFIFKYGLALAIMGLLDSAKKTPEWETDDKGCRERVEVMATGVAKVIVPLCLSLPKNLPKMKPAAA